MHEDQSVRDRLEKIANQLWQHGAANHRFRLSPDCLQLTKAQVDQLAMLGQAIYGSLAGVCRIVGIAAQPALATSRAWKYLRRVLNVGVPKEYHEIQHIKPPRGNVPAVIKVDLMCDTQGRLRIAEIDAQNKHGMGYSTLAAQMRAEVYPCANVLGGVCASIAREMQLVGSTDLLLLYADQERFYKPEFLVLASALGEYGIKVTVAGEYEMAVRNSSLVAESGQQAFRNVVDLPFMSKTCLGRDMVELYRDGRIHFLIPPKPFLSSKSLLALLRNDRREVELEAILRSQIARDDLRTIRRFIPETYLIGNDQTGDEVFARARGRWVLKETVSSGMKGTVFSDDPHFATVLNHARSSHGRYIAQKEVTNRSYQFRYYDGAGVSQGIWYTRITAHYCRSELADVITTARPDKKVHGAPDCLQLGTIIV